MTKLHTRMHLMTKLYTRMHLSHETNGPQNRWKYNVFSVKVGFRFICTSMSANTGAYNTCHKLLKQTPFNLSFLEKFWHLLLAPLFSLKTLKCAPLLPQCWATRILELSDDCNTQINIGEGETNTNVSRFEASIVAPQGNEVSVFRWVIGWFWINAAHVFPSAM